MNRKINHNKEKQRFELPLDNDEVAFVNYRKNGDHLDLTYSEVPVHLRGQGIGKELVIKTFEKIEEEGYTATAYCSYIVMIAKRDSYWREQIAY